MTNPTRQEIIDSCHEDEITRGLKRVVRLTLPPKLLPTMAEIEWLDGVHWLAEAKHKDGRTVIMLTRDSSRINFIWDDSIEATHPQNLTPTGRLYALTEVQE